MNSVNLIGRLSTHVKRNTKKGFDNATFTLKIEQKFFQRDLFVPIICHGSLAARVKKYVRKDFLLGVEGILVNDEETGVIEVFADSVTFLQWPVDR